MTKKQRRKKLLIDAEELRKLVRQWKYRMRTYAESSTGIVERPRCEGISTGTRWCAEDLDEVLANKAFTIVSVMWFTALAAVTAGIIFFHYLRELAL